MTPTDIGVVIPTLNEAAGIDAAIRSVAGAGEIIVVDGGSQDATLQIAACWPQVSLVTTAASRGLQLAAGARRCRSPVLLFLHGDCRLAAGALEQLCDKLNQNPQHGWGAMQQRIDSPQWRFRLLEWGNACRIKYRGLPFGDQAMFMRRCWYEAAGGFEAIPLMEDLRLSLRLRRRRWPLMIEGPVIISPRRWRRRGILRQTLLNVCLQIAHVAGASPHWLSRFYR